jgi:tRNA(fMet)-specific endonuclease VapC
MEPHLLLDTNIIVYLWRKRIPAVLSRFQKLNPGEAVISVITLGELMYGAERSSDRQHALQNIQEITRIIQVANLPEGAAAEYGRARAELEQRGQSIGNNDLWLAAHALAAKLTLVTNNEREFRRVNELSLQNWAV